MHLEEQMGTVSRGFTEEQLSKLNTFIFNSKFNPNCNNQDRFFIEKKKEIISILCLVVLFAVLNILQEID